MTKYRVGTRGSRLALAQTQSVCERLKSAFPQISFEVVVIKTVGDSVLDRPIRDIGVDAPFTQAIERALISGEIDLAVHSMKDLASELPEGLVLGKAWTRCDARDALICRGDCKSLDELPRGAVVATGSLRRSFFLARRRPDIEIIDIRGNVDTRLRKLFNPASNEREIDALVLAAAGLIRLGKADLIADFLDPSWMIPAPNQGQLAIEMRLDDKDLRAIVDSLGDDDAERIASAERTFLRSTGGNCRDIVAAYARIVDGEIQMEKFHAKPR